MYLKKGGVTDHPSELNLSKVNATDTIPSCELISFFARALVHDVAWRCDMNCVRSKEEHKQLARTSLKYYCDQNTIFSSDFETLFTKQSPCEILCLNFEKKTVYSKYNFLI